MNAENAIVMNEISAGARDEKDRHRVSFTKQNGPQERTLLADQHEKSLGESIPQGSGYSPLPS